MKTEILILLPLIAVALSVWLSIIASLALKNDKTLTIFQFYAQFITVWIIPIFGPVLVLHFIYEHYPNAIELRLIPWPFKSMVTGKKVKSNTNRDENEQDYSSVPPYHQRRNDNDIGDIN